MRAEDSQVIDRSQFGSKVDSGMILEISIILRQTVTLHDNKGKCPRCGHINVNVIKNDGWIKWQVLKFFATYSYLTLLIAVPSVRHSYKLQRLAKMMKSIMTEMITEVMEQMKWRMVSYMTGSFHRPRV